MLLPTTTSMVVVTANTPKAVVQEIRKHYRNSIYVRATTYIAWQRFGGTLSQYDTIDIIELYDTVVSHSLQCSLAFGEKGAFNHSTPHATAAATTAHGDVVHKPGPRRCVRTRTVGLPASPKENHSIG